MGFFLVVLLPRCRCISSGLVPDFLSLSRSSLLEYSSPVTVDVVARYGLHGVVYGISDRLWLARTWRIATTTTRVTGGCCPKRNFPWRKYFFCSDLLALINTGDSGSFPAILSSTTGLGRVCNGKNTTMQGE